MLLFRCRISLDSPSHFQAVTGLVSSRFMLPLAALELVSVCYLASNGLHQRVLILVRSLDYVNNNPAAFKNAYFDFAGLRVYQ